MTDYIFTARGTGEPYWNNMLRSVVLQLPAHVVHEEVQHRASISLNNRDGDPLAPSGDNCATQIVNWLDARVARLGPDDRYAAIGYSLGGVGVTRWLNRGEYDHRLLAAGNIANPARAAGTNTGNFVTPSRAGIYRMWQTPSGLYRGTIPALYEIAHERDVMTSCPDKSPLPEFAGPVMAFELGNPFELIAQLQDGGINAIVRDFKNVQNWVSGDWWGWAGQLRDFATWAHTKSYTDGVEKWTLPNGAKGTGVACLAAHLSKHYNN